MAKKIYLIYEFLSEQGGLEREIIIHGNYLKEAGYDVKVLTCHLDPKILKLLPFEGLKIEEISTIKSKYEAVKLITCFLGFNKLKKYNPDAFLSYSAPCNFLIRNKKAKKINYINHFPHFLYLKGKEKIEWAASTQGMKRWISVVLSWILGPLLKKTDTRLVRINNLNFTNSEFTKKRIDSIYSINTIVSYPPLDKRFFPVKQTIKQKFIFSSSRIIPDKKYEWLIEAVSYMKNKRLIFVAGTVQDSYKNVLLSLAKKYKVELKFLGRLTTEQIREYYSSAEVFAFPTPEEDFGLVPAESLACGTPVVVWGDGAGPTEQVINGVNGYHAKPYELKDFAAKIDKIIDSNMKKKNYKKIIESSKKFSAAEVKKNFLKEFEKIL